MKKNKGIAILLFAILLQMCSTGMELFTLALGAVGLVVTIIDDSKKDYILPMLENAGATYAKTLETGFNMYY